MYSNPTPHTNSGRKKTSSIKAQTQMTVIVLGTIRDTDGLNVEKKAGRRKLHSASLLLDDLADSQEFHNNRNLMAKIFLKGRHMGVS